MPDLLETGLPDGRYLSAVGGVRLDKGGQTAAMLLRSRILSESRGEPVDVLTFDPCRWYEQIRRRLTDAGQLSHGMRLLNLFEHYRDHGWGTDPGTGEGLVPVGDLARTEVAMKNGSPWKTQYLDRSGTPVLTDYRRADGSVYLRAATYDTKHPDSLQTIVTRVAPDGEIVGRYAQVGDLYRRWLTELAAASSSTYLFMDSRFLVPIIAPFDLASLHLVYVLHNCHLPYPRRWSTPPRPDYARLLERIGDVSAFVTLTRRQRSDIVRAWGDPGNLAVVPNPVAPAAEPARRLRDPRRVVVIGRLENQKRVDHALLVWTRVLRRVPDARLDVYGTGSDAEHLQQQIDERGLAHSVRLRGFDPEAREQLWNASACLVTSRYEGYPLVILESMQRGCPVVSYDVTYGPREQITSSENGFLVADGDVAAAAKCVVRLLQAPALVAQLGGAAQRSAQEHDDERFVADWGRVLTEAAARRGARPRRRLWSN